MQVSQTVLIFIEQLNPKPSESITPYTKQKATQFYKPKNTIYTHKVKYKYTYTQLHTNTQ